MLRKHELYQVTLINGNVGTLYATSLRGWEKIVYYSCLMRHDITPTDSSVLIYNYSTGHDIISQV
ncbi:MAG: hypothetical protein WBA93_07455 [Microcoleaceae cyanobacterium]